MVLAKDLHSWVTEAVLPKGYVLLTELKARVPVGRAKVLLMEHDQVATARVHRTLANPAVLRTVPVLRTMQSVQEVLIRALVLMVHGPAVRTRVLLTAKNLVTPIKAHRRNRPDGEVGTDF